jgi:hypothetical protein
MARSAEIGDLRRATLILGNLGVVAINSGDLALAEQRLTSTSATPRGWVTAQPRGG